MLNASRIITDACQIARVPRYTVQALDELNAILQHVCRTVDYAAAVGVFDFTFATALVSSGAGNIITASPNPLPIDYLRVQTSGGSTGAQRSSKWYIQGVPYDMVEIDLTEWDDQVQQAGIQSYPYFWAKDMSKLQIAAKVTGDLNVASQLVINVSSLTGILANMSIAGGIGPQSVVVPGSTVLSTAAALQLNGSLHANTTVDGISSTQNIIAGENVTSSDGGIPAGTTVASIDNVNQITLSAAATTTAAVTLTFSNHLTLSAAPAASLAGSTLMIGNPPVGLPYPPPSGAYPARIRYQRLMPDLSQAQVDAGAFPWFDDDVVLIDGLAGRMMQYSADNRKGEFGKTFAARMAEYQRLADDRANRADVVLLDRRVFGRSFSTLRNTKTVGWLVLLSFALAGTMGFPIC